MVLYTGDIHGDINPIINALYKYEMKQNDIICVLGDVGLNYYLDDRDTQRKNKLNNKLIQHGTEMLCVHGNHEERPFNINSYITKNWHGGIVYVEEAFPNILFAKDGEIYDLDGKKSIVVGGAYSVDKFYRLQSGYPWFKDEQPSEKIKLYVENQLHNVNWKIDQVLSHTCPIKYTPVDRLMKWVDQSTVDKSTEFWLDSIEDKLEYERWLCGHWHIDRTLGKLRFLMDDYIT